MARINYVELPAANFAGSLEFYADAFGWSFTSFGPSYVCTMTGDVDVGLQGDLSDAPKAPLPVIDVSDLESALTQVSNAGGTITRPIFGFPAGAGSTSATRAAMNWPSSRPIRHKPARHAKLDQRARHRHTPRSIVRIHPPRIACSPMKTQTTRGLEP